MIKPIVRIGFLICLAILMPYDPFQVFGVMLMVVGNLMELVEPHMPSSAAGQIALRDRHKIQIGRYAVMYSTSDFVTCAGLLIYLSSIIIRWMV